MARHRPTLLRYARSRLSHLAAEAEDVVQDASLRAASALRAGSCPDNVEAWLYAIVRNAAADAWRAGLRRASTPLDDAIAETGGGPGDVSEQRERIRTLTSAIGGLPPRQREALVLSALEGESYAAIATRQGSSVSAVKALVNRARTGLRGAAGLVPLPWTFADRLASLWPARAGAGVAGAMSLGKGLAAGAAAVGVLVAAPVATVQLGHREARVAAVAERHAARDPALAEVVRRLTPRRDGPKAVRVSAPVSAGCPADRLEYAGCLP